MSALTIPAAVWEHHRPGEPLVAGIVKGERWHHELMPNVTAPGPPADLAALADARCETCDDGCDIYACCVGKMGSSVTNWDYLCDRHRGHQGFHDCDGCCPDCHDGRLLVEVRVECGCDGGVLPAGTIHPKVWGGQPAPCDTICPEDCDDGYRTVTGLLDLVPVEHIDDDDGGGSYCGHARLVVNPANGWVDYEPEWDGALETDDCHALTPAHVAALADACGRQPDEWVGGWAWLFTEVAR